MEIEVDSVTIDVSSGTTIMQALQELGYQIKRSFSAKGLFMPCQLGGCWACAVDIDGHLERACITLVRPGMKIKTTLTNLSPIRLIGGFMGHSVGGVGTPWWLKGYCIEVACFASGCNFRCPPCQNWQSTYASSGRPLLPQEAAKVMTETRMRYGVNRLAISGGECTLNRPWLLQYLRNLREQNPGARLHVDTNGSILTNDYLDELVCAGMTDIGIDLKAFRLSTFEKITGLNDTELAEEYMKTAWKAIEYLLEKYPTIFLGVGIPYNQKLISLDEIEQMGHRLSQLDPWMQVCVLDYRPEFKRWDIVRPSYQEMLAVHHVLESTGLESVVCQTMKGRIGPSGILIE